MPIRFTCPHCRQKLSVAQRKAGSTAECPRCKRSLSIPQLPEPTAQKQALTAAESAAATAAAPGSSGPPAGESAIFSPDADEFAGLELVYDTSSGITAPAAPPAAPDVIVIPRYVVYLQGALLAVVALVAFAIGMMMGSTFVASPAPIAQACLITGSVTYASGPRTRPDVGAVVILLPRTPHRPEEKTPIKGLRPGEPSPEAGKGLAILRQMGGGYVRTDANGSFQIEVPARGRYLLLVISHDKRSRGGEGPKAADLLKLSPFFDHPAELLDERRYQLSEETIRGDRQLTIAFD
jgi:hypothetical protein